MGCIAVWTTEVHPCLNVHKRSINWQLVIMTSMIVSTMTTLVNCQTLFCVKTILADFCGHNFAEIFQSRWTPNLPNFLIFQFFVDHKLLDKQLFAEDRDEPQRGVFFSVMEDLERPLPCSVSMHEWPWLV